MVVVITDKYGATMNIKFVCYVYQVGADLQANKTLFPFVFILDSGHIAAFIVY